MHQFLQFDSSKTAINVSKFPDFAKAVADALAPAQQDTPAGQKTECLLQRIAFLEFSNIALLNKLNFAQRELDALRLVPAATLPIMEPSAVSAQTYGWERKLTRTGWRPA